MVILHEIDELPEEGVASADSVTHLDGGIVRAASYDRDLLFNPRAFLSYAFVLSSYAFLNGQIPFGPTVPSSSTTKAHLLLFDDSTVLDDEIMSYKYALLEVEDLQIAPLPAPPLQAAVLDAPPPQAAVLDAPPPQVDDPALQVALQPVPPLQEPEDDGFTIVKSRKYGMRRGMYPEGPYITPKVDACENEIPWGAIVGNRRVVRKTYQDRRGGWLTTNTGPGFYVYGSYGPSSLEF